jgi:hypothetical protein
MEKLPIGRIPADQCRLAIADILRSLFSYEITSQTDATNKLQWFCLLPREENGARSKDFETEHPYRLRDCLVRSIGHWQ